MIIDARVRLPHDGRPQQDVPPPERLVAGYQAALGVVVHTEYEWGDPADALNEAVAPSSWLSTPGD
jgi:hypothetical protein